MGCDNKYLVGAHCNPDQILWLCKHLELSFVFLKVMSNQFKSKLLTYEREDRRQQEVKAVAVHGECDDKVHGQTPKQEDGVYYRPVCHVQPQLKSNRDRTHLSPNTDKFQKKEEGLCKRGKFSVPGR